MPSNCRVLLQLPRDSRTSLHTLASPMRDTVTCRPGEGVDTIATCVCGSHRGGGDDVQLLARGQDAADSRAQPNAQDEGQLGTCHRGGTSVTRTRHIGTVLAPTRVR